MRVLLPLLFVIVAACAKKSEVPASTSVPAGSGSGSVGAGSAAAPRVDAGMPATPKVSKEQRAAYRKHLSAGRKLGAAKRWGEAAVEFEAALVAIPMDGPALTELGLAAYASGDFKKARKANLDAIRVAGEPKVRAASYYNLGLVAMAEHDEKAAADAFRASLTLRPGNKTVAKALSSLGHTPPAPGARDHEVTCATPGTIDEICACLVKAASEFSDAPDPDHAPSCGPLEDNDEMETHATLPAGFQLLGVAGPEHQAAAYLVAKSGKSWRVVDELGTTYNPGAFGISESLSIDKIEQKHIGTHDLLWIETTHAHIDNDAGVNEGETTTTHDLLVCPLAGTYRCTLAVTLDYSYDRSILIDDPDANADVQHTPGLPLTDHRSLAVTLGPDGVATVTLEKGKAPDVPGLLGPHPLW